MFWEILLPSRRSTIDRSVLVVFTSQINQLSGVRRVQARGQRISHNVSRLATFRYSRLCVCDAISTRIFIELGRDQPDSGASRSRLAAHSRARSHPLLLFHYHWNVLQIYNLKVGNAYLASSLSQRVKLFSLFFWEHFQSLIPTLSLIQTKSLHILQVLIKISRYKNYPKKNYIIQIRLNKKQQKCGKQKILFFIVLRRRVLIKAITNKQYKRV